MGRVQRTDPQRVGGHQELGRPVGRRDHRSSLPQGVRRLSFLGSSGYRRHGVRGARDLARGARRDRLGRARDARLPRVVVGIALLAALLASAACDGRKRTARAAVIPPQQDVNYTAFDSPSLQFLPRQQEAPGWQLEEDPIVVPGNRLINYLDRDGAHFIRYEAIDLTVGKYRSTQAPAGFATVEIFRFPDFVKAFGAYSTRKVGQVRFLDVPNESFMSTHSVHLWRGPFYVRILGGGTPDGNESLKRLLAFVAERMPAAPAKPAVFNFFPVTNRAANSE